MPVLQETNASKLGLNDVKAAAYLGVSPTLMRKWRIRGQGPRFRRLNRIIRYSTEDLDTFWNSLPTSAGRKAPKKEQAVA